MKKTLLLFIALLLIGITGCSKHGIVRCPAPVKPIISNAITESQFCTETFPIDTTARFFCNLAISSMEAHNVTIGYSKDLESTIKCYER
jgi:hypothetical protein